MNPWVGRPPTRQVMACVGVLRRTPAHGRGTVVRRTAVVRGFRCVRHHAMRPATGCEALRSLRPSMLPSTSRTCSTCAGFNGHSAYRTRRYTGCLPARDRAGCSAAPWNPASRQGPSSHRLVEPVLERLYLHERTRQDIVLLFATPARNRSDSTSRQADEKNPCAVVARLEDVLPSQVTHCCVA